MQGRKPGGRPELDLKSLQAQQQQCFKEEYRNSTRGLHPVTHVADTYCAADRSTKQTSKHNTEKLCDIDIVKQLRDNLNTQVEEQLFHQLGRDTYFLNMLTPSNYLFVLCLLLHLHTYHRGTDGKSYSSLLEVQSRSG